MKTKVLIMYECACRTGCASCVNGRAYGWAELSIGPEAPNKINLLVREALPPGRIDALLQAAGAADTPQNIVGRASVIAPA